MRRALIAALLGTTAIALVLGSGARQVIAQGPAPPISIAQNDVMFTRLLQQLQQLQTSLSTLSLHGSLGERIGSAGGALNVNVPAQACDTRVQSVAISQTGNAKLQGGLQGKNIYICYLLVVGADAENVSLVEGTGSTCGTNTSAVIGGTTAANGPNLAANGGFTAGNGDGVIAATGRAGDDVCLFQSGSGRVAGVMAIAIQ